MATSFYRAMGERYPPSRGNSDHDNRVVGFRIGPNREESLTVRQKYLTAKYGQDQMKLIRKRLAVEDWMDLKLRKLYDVEDAADTYDTEIDLDYLLDIDEDRNRRIYIQERVASARKSPEVINKFIEEVLKKADTL